jgi:hypothetical protein
LKETEGSDTSRGTERRYVEVERCSRRQGRVRDFGRCVGM